MSIEGNGKEVDCTMEDLEALKDQIKRSFYYRKQDYYGNYEFPKSGAFMVVYIF